MVSFAPGKIVDAEHSWWGKRRRKRATDETKQGPGADRQSQQAG
jgi:hypothetical protein